MKLTIEEFDNYITKLGHRPACPTICVPKINRLIESGEKNFKMFVNIHNLCWTIDDEFIKYHSDDKDLSDRVFTLNMRDFKLASIGIV
jgi:hypothetical protein